jgi:type IV pilus assembly protein PilE
MNRKKTAGFTLIELVVVLAIVAILAAIAFPSYQNYLRKGRRADAQTFLMDIANREQQYLLDARSYATGSTAIATLGWAATPESVGKYYNVSVAAGAATPSFVITATPISGGPQAPDGALTLDNTGAKTLNGASGW